ncbi:MAG: recombinase family protein [Pseudomonadota bacterium]
MSKPLAYSYVRMSTELQLKGDSLRRQTELSEKYADEHGLELVRDFQLHDIGVSAYKGANIEKGALGQFLQAVELGDVPKGSFLLVESLDRLSRQAVSNSVNIFLQITRSGINLVTLADNQFYPAGEDIDFAKLIYSIVVMARANEESQMKSNRISAAWESKRNNVGTRVLTKWCPAWLSVAKDRKSFEILEDRTETVRRIFACAAAGQGSGVITRNLNFEQVPPFGKSSGWLESYVTKILKNRAVLGEFQPHRRINGKRVPNGPVIKGYFPKIIEEELFLRVQAGRRHRSIGGGGRRGPKQRNLFTHIAKCGYCGSSMRFINKGSGPKGRKYLRCSASVRGMGCVSTSWRYDAFEASLFSFVREFDLRSVVEDNQRRSEFAILHEEILVQQEKLASKRSERERVFQLLIQAGEAAEDYLGDQLNLISEEITAIEKLVSDLELKKGEADVGRFAQVQTDEQLAALEKLTEEQVFSDRLLVSNKLRELIFEIKVFSDGKRPKLLRAEEQIYSLIEDKRERDQVLAELRESYLNGPFSHPHFIVVFANGIVRIIAPDASDPTKLIEQVDSDEEGIRLTDRSGQTLPIIQPSMEYDEDLQAFVYKSRGSDVI